MPISLSYIILPFDALSTTQLYDILQLRSRVFIVEQNIVYLDPDGYDQLSLHIGLYDDNTLVGCVRIIPPGVKFNDVSIGRFAVDISYRGKGWGTSLFRRAIDEIHARYGNVAITIEAQHYLKDYYRAMGFAAISEPYMLEGILHIKMQLPPVTKD